MNKDGKCLQIKMKGKERKKKIRMEQTSNIHTQKMRRRGRREEK